MAKLAEVSLCVSKESMKQYDENGEHYRFNDPRRQKVDYNLVHAQEDGWYNQRTQHMKSLEKGETLGAIISWPVADGSAVYLVVNDKPLTLQHVIYGDSWHVPMAMIRGTRKQDILDHINWIKNVATLSRIQP
jgi:hypothetical protein